MPKTGLSFRFSVVLFTSLFFVFCSCAAFSEEATLKVEDGIAKPVSTEETEDLKIDGGVGAEALKPRNEAEPVKIEVTNSPEDEGILPLEKNDWAEDNDEDDDDDGTFDSEATMDRDDAHAAEIEEMDDWAEDDSDNLDDEDDNDVDEDDDDEEDRDFPEDTAMELRDDAGSVGAEETNAVVEDKNLVEGKDESDKFEGSWQVRQNKLSKIKFLKLK